MVTQMGSEQQIPPQATVIKLGFPAWSNEPMTQAGVGWTSVLAPIDFFMMIPPCNYLFFSKIEFTVYTDLKRLARCFSTGIEKDLEAA